jgi:sugar porter (SP) family MFS transporter
LAPPQYRGEINSVFELTLSLGILFANIVNYYVLKIKAGWGWRISLSMAAAPAAFLTISALFLPETPSFMIQRDGNTNQARIVLQKLRGTTSVQKELDDLVCASNISRTTKHPFRNIFERKYRPQLVISIMTPFANQVSGINVINFYAPVMFRTIGLKESASLLSAMVTRLCATCANILAMVLVDRTGRRKLLLVGGVLMILSQLTLCAILAAKFKDHEDLEKGYAYLVLIIMCVFVAGYGWSWGPLTYLIPAEVCPLEIRSAGQSIVIAVNFFMTFVIGQTFLAILCHIKSATFVIFGGLIFLMTLFVYLFLPETKKVPIEQMKQLWSRHWFWKNIVREEEGEEKQSETITSLRS